jgi:hypothetical protein
MKLFNKVSDFFGRYFGRHFYYSTITEIVEVNYSGMDYNLSIQDDETYIADGFLVHNCRSVVTSVLSEEFDFLDEGATRASKGAEGGKQVSADTTYYSWLKTQPVAFQNAAIGTSRATLLRNGGLTSDEFARLSLGKNFNPLTLDEMRRLEPAVFERAGL